MKFDLSYQYCEDHFLDPLGLNLMCVRIKDPNGRGRDTGYWVAHFQILEEVKREDTRKSAKVTDKSASAKKDQDVSSSDTGLGSSASKEKKGNSIKDQDTCPTLPTSNSSGAVSGSQNAKKSKAGAKRKPNPKKNDEYRSVVARLIHSSSPAPESLITQEYCNATVELIFLSIPDRLVEIVFLYVVRIVFVY